MKIFLSIALVVTYVMFLSLGLECLLNLLGMSTAISLDGADITEQYPRFIPFCLIAGLLSLGVLITTFILHIKLSDKFAFSKKLWQAQMIVAAVISIPMIKLWEIIFEFLQKSL